jgi:nitrate reductase gamma subunit
MFTEFVDGPFWYFSVTVFVVGVAWRFLAMLLAGRRPELSVARASAAVGAIRTNLSRFLPRREIAGRIRLHVVAGYMFHLGLFALLLFAAPHVDFIKERITGFGWTPMPHWAFILASEFAFIGLLILWLHRVLNPVTRLLSRADDHIAAILTFVVMLTGCLALFQSFEGLRTLHLFLAELLLVYFPFSSLMHALMFVPSRGYTGAMLGRRGIHA